MALPGPSLLSTKKSSTPQLQKKKLTDDEIIDLHQELQTDDHIIPLDELCIKLNTNIDTGLTGDEAKLRLAQSPNALTPPKVTPEYIKLLKSMFSGFATLLWICAGLCFLIYLINYLLGHDSNADEGIEWFGVMIIVICLISGMFSYIQEGKNSRVMESFTRMVPTFALVIRDGEKILIPTEEIVLGDIVEIRLGDKIPADIRIIRCVGLRVENSSITGESEPIARSDYPTDPNPLESQNMAFFSSYAVAGEGTGIVIATGDQTMIGRLAGLTTQVIKDETPIAKEINNFVQIITVVSLVFGGLFFIISLIIEPNIIKSFIYLLSIVISNIPEVLLVTVTTSLTLTAKKMANKNCLVRNLEAVETLGSTSTICSDKTGTLTQNKMTVSNMWFGNIRHHVSAVIGNLGVERDLLLEKPAFNSVIKAATLCLRAEFRVDSDLFTRIEDRDVIGDASETGILKFCEHIHSTKRYRANYPKITEVPFSSVTKYQLSIHRDDEGYNIFMKGAPEIVIDFCINILSMDGTTRSLTAEDIFQAKRACTELGFLGERVLAYCDLFLPYKDYSDNYEFNTSSIKNYNFPMSGYRFLGLISLLDPPRASVPDAVHTCRAAGIKVIMVTGDHPVTAMAIAKTIGIIGEGHETRYEKLLHLDNKLFNNSNNKLSTVTSTSENNDDNYKAIIVTGTELRFMTDNELDNVIKNYEEIVFARTSPQQKLIIVESCQRIGEIVAVTGDGVNDSPALRKADIGIAMGITGSDVAKSAADMVLMDDNFSSIVTGIEEGRLIFDNLKKSIVYTLTSGMPEMIPMLSSLILSIPLPLVIELVLCIDIGTDLLPAIALAYEKPESDIMKRPPRNPQYDKLVNKRLISMAYGQIGMTQALAGFMNYFLILGYHGFLPGDLFGLRQDWENKNIVDLKDSYGQTWNYESRMVLLSEARTGYFVAIVITQMMDLLMCKTRRNSLFQQGMDNWFLNVSIAFEILLTAVILYTPGADKIFKTFPIDPYWLLPCLPLGLFLWAYDEVRRYFIRKYPKSIIYRETYY
ncbi:sodium/potassium-transporting ATPase subunit alpha-B-like [Microplitis mediator]|uniref:sodium/potassium-transporting ATPase subunit alpha-B-like n=1 Tax=Microplitis mediator TaxID=375433 RepID=UPI002554F954|nr:sodium/potassium-transporting ATPase subunit alpha-B-like [Microplitis mediator]